VSCREGEHKALDEVYKTKLATESGVSLYHLRNCVLREAGGSRDSPKLSLLLGVVVAER